MSQQYCPVRWELQQHEWLDIWPCRIAKILYCPETQSCKLVAEHPNLSMGEMSKKLGEMWKATSGEERAKYEVSIPPPMHGSTMQSYSVQQARPFAFCCIRLLSECVGGDEPMAMLCAQAMAEKDKDRAAGERTELKAAAKTNKKPRAKTAYQVSLVTSLSALKQRHLGPAHCCLLMY